MDQWVILKKTWNWWRDMEEMLGDRESWREEVGDECAKIYCIHRWNFQKWNNKIISKYDMCSKKIIPLSNTIPPKMSLCLQNQRVSAWLWLFLQNSLTNLTQDTSGNRAQLCVYKRNCIPSPEPTIWLLFPLASTSCCLVFFPSSELNKHVLMLPKNLYLLYFILHLNDPQCLVRGQTRKKMRWNLPRPWKECWGLRSILSSCCKPSILHHWGTCWKFLQEGQQE